MGRKKYTLEGLKETFTELYGDSLKIIGFDRYDNVKQRITVECPKHGQYSRTIEHHLSGRKCKKCADDERGTDLIKRRGLKIIAEFKEIHGDRYDYSKFEYKGSETPSCIICPVHGEFQQTPYVHKISNGCSKCSRDATFSQTLEKRKKDFWDLVKDKHKGKLEIDLDTYVNYQTPMSYKCLRCGTEYKDTPNHLLYRDGCSLCWGYGDIVYSREFFDKHKDYLLETPAFFYICEVTGEGERFVKVGVSKNPDKRFEGKTQYNFQIVETYPWSMYEAFNIEQSILRMFSENRYHPKINFTGVTECLTYNTLVDVKYKLKEYMYDRLEAPEDIY